MPEPEYPPEINAHLWRNSRNITGRLRCGILLDSRGGVEDWAQATIDLLALEPSIALQAIHLIAAPAPPPPRSILFEWVHRWSSQIASPFKRVELRSPPGVPVTAGEPPPGLDVLIWLESSALPLASNGLARFGVWCFCFGDPTEPRSAPPYWKQVAQGCPVSTLALESSNGTDLRRLAVAHLATTQGLRATRNAVAPVSLAGPLLLRNLLDVVEQRTLPRAASQPLSQTAAWPGTFETAGLLARQSVRSASVRLTSRGRSAKWFVAVRNNRDLFRTRQNHFVTNELREVPANGGSQFADPFVVSGEDRQWLFVEEIPSGSSKGRLAVMELDRDGRTTPPVTIMDRPFHLSYPFVFRHGADFFMIPETSANHNIELHRATRFPFEWSLEKVLYSNVRAVDTSPLFWEGIWYFFTTSARLGQETFLFWSETLDGEWHYHPSNPISSDVRRARGAGPLFFSNGALIRPAQDCSVRYGYAIALNRVLKISPVEYAEELIETIYPKWRKGLLGTHHLCSNDSFEVIDGLTY